MNRSTSGWTIPLIYIMLTSTRPKLEGALRRHLNVSASAKWPPKSILISQPRDGWRCRAGQQSIGSPTKLALEVESLVA